MLSRLPTKLRQQLTTMPLHVPVNEDNAPFRDGLKDRRHLDSQTNRVTVRCEELQAETRSRVAALEPQEIGASVSTVGVSTKAIIGGMCTERSLLQRTIRPFALSYRTQGLLAIEEPCRIDRGPLNRGQRCQPALDEQRQLVTQAEFEEQERKRVIDVGAREQQYATS